MALAVFHVIGALVVSCALGALVLWLGAWEQKKVQKRRLQEVSIALGVPLASLESDDSLMPRLVDYLSQRFSSELLRNRLSDLCGAIRTAWGWLGNLIQFGIIVAVAWAMFAGGAESAAYMWSVPAVAVFFWLASVAFSLVCAVLTGRFPGEAKAGRKLVAEVIEQRHAP